MAADRRSHGFDSCGDSLLLDLGDKVLGRGLVRQEREEHWPPGGLADAAHAGRADGGDQLSKARVGVRTRLVGRITLAGRAVEAVKTVAELVEVACLGRG